AGRAGPDRTCAPLPRGLRGRPQPQPADDSAVRPLPRSPAHLVGARTTGSPGPAGADDRGRTPVQVGSRAPRQRAHRATTVAGHADIFPSRPSVVAALMSPAGSRCARAGPGGSGLGALTAA